MERMQYGESAIQTQKKKRNNGLDKWLWSLLVTAIGIDRLIDGISVAGKKLGTMARTIWMKTLLIFGHWKGRLIGRISLAKKNIRKGQTYRRNKSGKGGEPR